MASDQPDYVIVGQRFVAPELAPGLYVVATPIGNLRDITLRALETLCAADLVLCEDTRHSARLLDHYGISRPRAALHEHNEAEKAAQIVDRLKSGARIALVSDAGTPLLSDPGFPLVRAARAAGCPVFAIPGPSALLAALMSAGLPTDAFSFFGFLPVKSGARVSALATIADRTETLVFYESPRRLDKTLAAMAGIFGQDRQAVVARELTKRFEHIDQGTLAELAARYADTQTKGEVVIAVGGAGKREIAESDWRDDLAEALDNAPLRSAVDDIAARYGVKRKQVYDAALALKSTRS